MVPAGAPDRYIAPYLGSRKLAFMRLPCWLWKWLAVGLVGSLIAGFHEAVATCRMTFDLTLRNLSTSLRHRYALV